MAKATRTGVCQICKREFPMQELYPAQMIRNTLRDTIVKKVPDWSPDGFICVEDLNAFRIEHIREGWKMERGQISILELDVLDSLSDRRTLVSHMPMPDVESTGVGGRIADRVAEFGGSWKFILSFVAVLIGWIILNSVMLAREPFDPYPFILLNLVLSCVAALQAPIIMMSQNRQEVKDRIHAENDYQVNLKAELEIRHINERMDFLVRNQWQRLIEIQEMQMEMIEQLRKHIEQSVK